MKDIIAEIYFLALLLTFGCIYSIVFIVTALTALNNILNKLL